MRKLLCRLLLPTLVLGFACTEPPPAGPNGSASLTIHLTDAPGDIHAAVVTIAQVYLQGTNGRTVLLNTPYTVDFVSLATTSTVMLDNVQVPAGTYSELRFVVTGAYVAVEQAGGGTRIFASSPNYAGLPSGAVVDGELQLPSFATSGLKVQLPDGGLQIPTSGEVSLQVDFNVAQSFGHQAGNSGMWVMHPVVTATNITEGTTLTVTLALGTGVTLPTGVTLGDFQATLAAAGSPSQPLATVPFSSDGSGGYRAAFGFVAPGSYLVNIVVPSTVTGLTVSPPVPATYTAVAGPGTTLAFTLNSAPAIKLDPTSASFSATQGGASPTPQTVSITNSGGGSLSGLGTSISYGTGQGWLSASLSSTATPSTLRLSVATGTLTAGTYTATVNVTSPAAGNSPQGVSVTFVVAAPHGVIISIDVAGAGTAQGQGTVAISIDDATGAITGRYIDANNVRHGFLRTTDGTITTFDVPGAGTSSGEGTQPWSISAGAIAGVYFDPTHVAHSFLRAPDGTIASFDVPGARATRGVNVNSGGTIAGSYLDASSVNHGFLRASDGTITTFDVPGAGAGTGQGTVTCFVSCINTAGSIVGDFVDASNAHHGYLRAPDGAITKFDVPGAGSGNFQGTISSGINATGTITGAWVDANDVTHGFLRALDGSITMFDVPSAGTASGQGTFPEHINSAGEIVGEYDDANFATHGFLRAPDGSITTFDPPAAGTGSGQGTIPSAEDAVGAITGSYVDASTVYHGFLRTP